MLTVACGSWPPYWTAPANPDPTCSAPVRPRPFPPVAPSACGALPGPRANRAQPEAPALLPSTLGKTLGSHRSTLHPALPGQGCLRVFFSSSPQSMGIWPRGALPVQLPARGRHGTEQGAQGGGVAPSSVGWSHLFFLTTQGLPDQPLETDTQCPHSSAQACLLWPLSSLSPAKPAKPTLTCFPGAKSQAHHPLQPLGRTALPTHASLHFISSSQKAPPLSWSPIWGKEQGEGTGSSPPRGQSQPDFQERRRRVS